MRASRRWVRTWPGAYGEGLLVNTRDIRRIDPLDGVANTNAICCAPGCSARGCAETTVMRADRTTFLRIVCLEHTTRCAS